MHTKLTGLCVHLEAIALAVLFLGASNVAHAGTVNGMDDPNRVPGSFLVVLKSEHIQALKNPALSNLADKDNWRAAVAAADTEVAHIVTKLRKAHPNVRITAVMSHGAAPGFVLHASDDDAKAIADDDDVKEVDADSTIDAVKTIAMTNSVSPASSWGLERIDQLGGVSSSGWVNAYDWIATGAGVDVYIIDSGIMTSNVDFGGRATNDADFIVDGNPGWCVSTLTAAAAGHGTEVASIAGGTTYGVAKQARLHSVRVTGCNGAPDFSAFIEGLEWTANAASNQHAIVNISLEYLAGNLFPFSSLSQATQTFVTQSNTWLTNLAVEGVDIVIASGNNPVNGPNIDPGNSWPQDLNNYANSTAVYAFVVGATAIKSDNIWPQTSMGTTASGDGLPNIFAPGDQVTTAWITSTTATTSSQSGTSLAAPYVAGVMALAMQVSNPSDFGCDSSFYCVVEQSGYWGALKGNVQGAFNIELSSLVPGNSAPATVTSGGTSGITVTNPWQIKAAIVATINTLLVL